MWANTAKIAKEACGDKPMFFWRSSCTPAVAPVMERAALVGGADEPVVYSSKTLWY